MIYYFIISLLFLFNCLTAQVTNVLSIQEKTALQTFLRVLVEDSEAGYVLLNKKPVCIHGYYSKDLFRVNSDHHKETVALKEGALIWRKLKKGNSDTIIHVNETEDLQIGQAHVLVINVPLFHKVVNENLVLFQYVLGPAVTSEHILHALIDDDQPFHALLKYDKVLIGILLGFGAENSLYGSRYETILEAFNIESPPFLSVNLTEKKFEQEHLPFTPSLGFTTTQDEFDHLSKHLAVSSQKLQERRPNFIFGWFKDDKSNLRLISDLEEAQEATQKLIHSDDFLTKVLEQLIGENQVLTTTDDVKLDLDQKEVNSIMAKGLWEFLGQDDRRYVANFFEGMENPDFQNQKVERETYFPNYLSDFIKGKKNLIAANSYFHALDKNSNYQCIEPFKLYYRKIAFDDAQKETCQGSLVTLTYGIFSPSGLCLGHGHQETVNLKNTISGFARAINGMCIGETREILIHPSLGYGFGTSSLDKCIHLRAVVTLHNIHNAQPQSPIKQIDLDFLLDPETLQQRIRHYKNALRVKGADIASHLKKSQSIDLSQIKKHITNYNNNTEKHTPTTEEEQTLINHVHWSIYY